MLTQEAVCSPSLCKGEFRYTRDTATVCTPNQPSRDYTLHLPLALVHNFSKRLNESKLLGVICV